MDTKSNIRCIEVLSAQRYAAGTRPTTPIDMAQYSSGTFFVSAGARGTTATITCTIQHSPDGSTDWQTDASLTPPSQITAPGNRRIDITAPIRRFYRINTTSATDTYDYAVLFAGEPKDKP